MSDEIKTVMIGCGLMGQGHLKAIEQSNSFKLIAACDSNAQCLTALPKSLPRYRSIEDLLKDHKPDLAVLSLPTFLYESHVRVCAEAGVHIFCEKPFGRDLEGCRRMIAMLEANKVNGWVGGQRKYSESLRRALALLSDMHTQFATGLFSYFWPAFGPATWRHEHAKSGGIAIIDTGWHALDYMDYVMGLPESVFCQTTPLRGHPQIDNQAAVTLRYPSAAVVNLVFNYTSPKNAFDFHFFDGERSVFATPMQLTTSEGTKVEVVIDMTTDIGGSTPMTSMYQELARAFHGEKNVFLTDMWRAESVMRVVDACYRSAASQQVIRLDR